MAKVGRNAPCPCGSGQKYKRCCGSALRPLPAAEPISAERAPLPAGRAIERKLADLTRILTEREFASADEANAHLQDVMAGGVLPATQPRTLLEEAQDVMYDAWDARGAERVRLARRALKISPDCADAYVLLANETARTAAQAADLYAQGLAAGERALGAEDFREYEGHFWGVLKTRPYMRARLGLAQSLWKLGRREEAIEHEQELLRLNPNDNQGVRYQLLAWLLGIDGRAAVLNLLECYAGDVAASWAYGRALVNFRLLGDTPSTRALLARARISNPFVPAYLLGRTPIPQRLPEYMGLGDDAEAVSCADEQLAAWSMTPEALAWLERAEDEVRGGGGGGGRESVPRAMRLYYDGLVHLTDQVCATHLTAEYAQLCRRMAAALCRKRPSPVPRGWLKTWACGIAYAIGSVNFLFDRSQTPHLMAGELCALFGVSPSTGSAKATEIRRIFNLGAFDPDWCLPSKLAENPLAWMISVDGYVLDARYAPRPLQEEAVRRGLIPYLPGALPN